MELRGEPFGGFHQVVLFALFLHGKLNALCGSP